MPQIELSAGTIEYTDTSGGGPVIVLLHGLLMDATLWDEVTAADAFDNFPPGLTGRTLALTGKLPSALFGLVMQQMRLRPLRRLPVGFGWLTRRGDAATARWIKPVLTQPEIRRETARMLRAVFADKRLLLRAAESLPAFDRPALVVWAAGDRVMPPEHGRRLAGLLPDGVLRATVTFAVRTVRRAARILRDLHREQVHTWEIIWQASRAVPAARTGPLRWVLTLDGYQLTGSHLPDPSGRASTAGTKP